MTDILTMQRKVLVAGMFPGGTPVDVNVASWMGSTAPTVGQKTMANSLPVVIASNQSNVPIDIQAYGGTATTLGQKTMAASIPVVLPSDQLGTAATITQGMVVQTPYLSGGQTAVADEGFEVLAAAVRNASTQSAIFRYVGFGRGLLLVLQTTANPGGGQTLSVSLEARPGGFTLAVIAFGVVVTAANATVTMIAAPDIAGYNAAVVGFTKQASVPHIFDVLVTHSGAGNWTYSMRGIWLP